MESRNDVQHGPPYGQASSGGYGGGNGQLYTRLISDSYTELSVPPPQSHYTYPAAAPPYTYSAAAPPYTYSNARLHSGGYSAVPPQFYPPASYYGGPSQPAVQQEPKKKNKLVRLAKAIMFKLCVFAATEEIEDSMLDYAADGDDDVGDY